MHTYAADCQHMNMLCCHIELVQKGSTAEPTIEDVDALSTGVSIQLEPAGQAVCWVVCILEQLLHLLHSPALNTGNCVLLTLPVKEGWTRHAGNCEVLHVQTKRVFYSERGWRVEMHLQPA